MKALYFECKMGVAGDMMAASLLGLVDNAEDVVDKLNAAGIPNVEYKYSKVIKSGILGGALTVIANGMVEGESDHEEGHHHHTHDDHEHSVDNNEHVHGEHEHGVHRSMYEIEEIIENLKLDKGIKSDIREVYQLIAEAESNVHGVPVSQIHFHELGNMDAIADITAVCYLMHLLDPDKVIVSPVNVGGGTVKTAHGILPVPAPATAFLLNGIHSYESETIKSELCTPTGAALIKYFADEFANQPVMAVEKLAYGMGKKEFSQMNALRALLGEINEDSEQVVELICNIDDMTAEEIGYATERLFEEGALEVYTIAADMKKNRPGTLLSCVCRLDVRDKLVKQIFLNTTTLGVRENVCNRYVLNREVKKIDTPYGEVRVKKAYGYDVSRAKLEYDDLAGIARRTGKSLFDLKKELEDI